jgi:hypothetical protein
LGLVGGSFHQVADELLVLGGELGEGNCLHLTARHLQHNTAIEQADEVGLDAFAAHIGPSPGLGLGHRDSQRQPQKQTRDNPPQFPVHKQLSEVGPRKNSPGAGGLAARGGDGLLGQICWKSEVSR